MGLSMAERIIAEHQGRIQLESEQGKGTKVTMTLQDGR
jgi:signal transduction histidine kinase